MGHQIKRRGILAVAAFCAAVLICSIASADQLPPRKVFNSITPASASDVNYNFTLLWNHINGGKLAADNAPSFISKTGGSITSGGLKCITCGLTISGSSASTTASGRIKVIDSNAKLQMTSLAAGVASLVLEETEGSSTWTISKNAANNLIVTGASSGNYVEFNSPVRMNTNGITKEVQDIPMSSVPAAGVVDTITHGVTYQALRGIPGFAVRDGNVKIRALVECAAADATMDIVYGYQWVKDGSAMVIAGGGSFANVACTGTEFHTTPWITINGPASDSTGLYVIALDNDAATDLRLLTLQIQYAVNRVGNPSDN